MVRWELIPERKVPTQPLRDAMWSIYLHSTFRNGLKPPALVRDHGLEPLPLSDAVDTLTKSGSHRARLARAVRKIVAARLHQRDRLWGLLGKEDGERTYQSIVELARTVGVVLPELEQLPPREMIQRLLRQLQTTGGSGGCQISNSSCVACHDGLTLNTTVKGKLEVNRDPDDLVGIVDPRSWDDCHLFFLDTYRTETAPNSSGQWPRHPADSTTPIGTVWTGFLYEKVQAGPVIFENVLEITDFTHASDRVVLKYDEHRSWKTHFPPPFGSINGGIEIDFGESHVDQLGDGLSRISISKTVRFVDLTPGAGASIDYGELLNYWVPAMLCLWVDEETEISPCCE
jgi:hypothetical protein